MAVIVHPVKVKEVKIKLIDATKYSRNGKGIREFMSDLRKNVGDDIFYIKDRTTLLYTFLKQIKQVSTSVENTEDSVEIASKEVMRLKGITSTLTSKETFADLFTLYFVGYKSPPGLLLWRIENETRQRLDDITQLIKYYESLEVISAYLTDKSVDWNHDNKMKYDFYKRCIKEQQIILNYYLYGMKKRAKESSAEELYDVGIEYALSRQYRDYPFRFGHPGASEYFDCRKISLVRHRVGEVGISKIPEMIKLFKTKKSLFYKQLFLITSPNALFQHIDYNLKHLPEVLDRKKIFTELKRLFKTGKYLAFYALALPQIEGLFTDMVNISESDKPGKKIKSLPDKVNSLRKYHDYSDTYFDYYQYIVPALRNKFMHIGHDTDFKLKAYDLLTDLNQLLRIYAGLNNPLVKIQWIHTHTKTEDFTTYHSFSDYFDLLNQLKLKDLPRYTSIKKDITHFEKEFLSPTCNADYICTTAAEDIYTATNVIEHAIINSFDMSGYSVAFKHLTKKSFEKYLLNEKEKEKMENFYLLYDDQILTLKKLRTFFISSKEYLPSLKEDTSKKLEKAWSDNQKLINNILLLETLTMSDVV